MILCIIFKNHALLGGHTGNAFFWEDNEEFSYTNWAPAKPSGSQFTVKFKIIFKKKQLNWNIFHEFLIF